MRRLTTIELHKENMKFSVAHFTIFSATEREPLHGHNYLVSVALTNWVSDNGMSFDYRDYKEKVYQLCRQLNQRMLLPTKSPYLLIEEVGEYCQITFNQKKLTLLSSDVKLLPISNITVEDLSSWFVAKLIEDLNTLTQHAIEKIVVKVFSAPGQSGSCTWERISST